tara:strand:- start:808 stop:1137 length:330 start_codon:yes stop_codon:yes gene_type:complete
MKRECFRHTFALLIILGVILGPLGLLLNNPMIAGIGNAMFLAGFFTPVYFLKYIRFKESIFGLIWIVTVLHLAYESKVSVELLLSAIPLFWISVFVSKIAGTRFEVPKR